MRIRVSSSVAAQFAALGCAGIIDTFDGADWTLEKRASSTFSLMQ